MFITYTMWGSLGSIRQCLTPRSLWPGHTRLSLYLDLLGSKPLLFIHTFSWAPRWSFSSSLPPWPLCMSSSGLQNLTLKSISSPVVTIQYWGWKPGRHFHFFLSHCPPPASPHAVEHRFSIFWNSLQMHPLPLSSSPIYFLSWDGHCHLDHWANIWFWHPWLLAGLTFSSLSSLK